MVLNKREIKKFYDNFGVKQDYQSFYENAAIEILIKNGDFQNAKSVIEFGCGTGAFAKDLLENQLPVDCEYVGIDLSETMIGLAKEKLEPFETRAKVRLSDGSTKLPFPDNSFDRFISNYVLDILTDQEITQVFGEANRVLSENGSLCLTSLSCGEGLISKRVSTIWDFIHKHRPKLVGGCRPLNLIGFVDRDIWEIKSHSKVSRFGITSEVSVAEKFA